MTLIPDKSIDMVLTDPPYGITGSEWDIIPDENYFNEIFRISKKQIIFGGHFMNLPKKDGWIIWNKMPFLKTTNQAEFIWTSFLSKNIIIDFRYAGNVIGNTFKPNYKIKKIIFTSQKPVKFIEYLINKYTNKNDIICDPFNGSGTTAIACVNTNRNYICMEKEKKYFDVSVERVKNHQLQQKINFEPIKTLN